jgi:hypothetical protein
MPKMPLSKLKCSGLSFRARHKPNHRPWRSTRGVLLAMAQTLQADWLPRQMGLMEVN